MQLSVCSPSPVQNPYRAGRTARARRKGLDRRRLLRAMMGVAAAGSPAATLGSQTAPAVVLPRRVRPYDPHWPSASEWEDPRNAVGGCLEAVTSPLANCERGSDGRLCEAALKDLSNLYYIQDQAGATQTAGWLGGWTSAPQRLCDSARKRRRRRGRSSASSSCFSPSSCR